MSGPLPIADHGLVGDLRTAAVVGVDGTIGWFCPGRFDAPSVFASLLDTERGGSWTLTPDEEPRSRRQFYLPDSAVLVTRLHGDDGAVEVHDLMPILRPHDPDHRQRLVRRVRAVRGTVRLSTRIDVRPDYGRASVEITAGDDGALLLTGDGVRLGLSADVDLQVDDGVVTAELDLADGETATFVLEVLDDDASPSAGQDTDALLAGTTSFWREWLSRSTYTGRWREQVERSAITLKLLTHEPTGAIVAAPTASLPEDPGGSRNWDYRYVWMRDAAFSLYALLRLGFTDEARDFVRWLSERLGETADHDLGPLRVLYDIDGGTPEEIELDHLTGYADSRPVRVGNAATGQLQLDIYGELIDSIYLFNKYGPGISHDAWQDLVRILEWLADHWDEPDAGMWEIRDEPRNHTTSLLMCWVAFERMIRVARQRGLPGPMERWLDVRDAIHAKIQDEGWDADLESYVQHRDAGALDAGLLLMPMVKFTSPADPRFLSTLEQVEERLVSDSLVYRYDLGQTPDGVDGTEGTFSMCSFWYVEALTRVGRLDDARLALEKMFTYANHLGLYAEQIGMNGEQLGNFPQAFTHLSLISAVINLDRSL